MKVIACNSNPELSKAIADYMDIPLTKASIKRFSDMEVFCEILENVRGEDVFVIQSTCYPANDHMMELLVTLDALRRGSARRITAVIPYFGYARQDRKTGPRSPITAKLVANIITSAGADRVLTMELHAGQIQGFFDIPLDNLIVSPVFLPHMQDMTKDDELVLVSPDVGGVVRARAIAKKMNADLAIIDKRREKAGVSEVMNVIGHVEGKTCVLVDDIVDSGGTLCNAAAALIENGAKRVLAYVVHGVLTGQAVEKITASKIEKLVVTDSIPATPEVAAAHNIEQVSVNELMGEAILRISEERSISALFR